MDSDNPCDWLPDSPFRSPAWRWLRAGYLDKSCKQPDPRLDDEWVGLARRLRAHAGPHGGRHAGPPPDGLDRAAVGAFDLWRGDQPLGRWRLEALLLTPEPLEQVARACALPAAVVDAYHQLFFDVRPHLAASDWVMWKAVGCGPWNDFAGGHMGGMWKYAAYAAGPRALEVVIAVTTDQPLPAWVGASTPDNPAYREGRLRLACKLTLAAMTAPSDESLHPMVEARARLRDLDRLAGGVPDEAPMLPAMEQFLEALGKPRRAAPKGLRAAPNLEAQRHAPARPKRSGLRKRAAEILALER